MQGESEDVIQAYMDEFDTDGSGCIEVSFPCTAFYAELAFPYLLLSPPLHSLLLATPPLLSSVP